MYVLEGAAVGDVEQEEPTHRVTVVRPCDGPAATRSVIKKLELNANIVCHKVNKSLTLIGAYAHNLIFTLIQTKHEMAYKSTACAESGNFYPTTSKATFKI